MDEGPATSIVLVCGPLSRTAVALAIAGIDVLARTGDPGEAVRLVRRLRPQVTVVDVDDTGVEAVATITGGAPGAAVLAVSGRPSSAPSIGALAAVRAGASGYLLGPQRATALRHAVRRAAAGESVFSPGLADVVLAGHAGPVVSLVPLTDREAVVLRLVVEGLTARQIAGRLVLSPRTVENHVQRVLRKLGLPNRASMVRYAIENGLA